MTVQHIYIVYEEFNDRYDEPALLLAFRTKEDAHAFADAQIKKRLGEGDRVWGAMDDDSDDWDVDVHVEELELV